MKSTVRANVTVQVEIPGHSTWAADTTIEQVVMQALSDFKGIIRLLNSPSIVSGAERAPHHIKVVGEPRVLIVTVEPDMSK
jgi:hypothetical protein